MKYISEWYSDYVSKVGKPQWHQGCWHGDGSNWDSNTNSVYAVGFSNGKLWRSPYHVCFGNLNELHREELGYGRPEAILLQIQSPLCEDVGFDEAMRHTYYEWLLNLSPYRDCFITKDYRKALTDRVVVLDAKSEANLMVGACSAVRLPWEYYYSDYNLPSIARLWYELVAQGDDPNAAMAVANNFSGDDKSWNTRSTTAGHQFLEVDSARTILNFISGRHLTTDSFSDVMEIDEDYSVSGIWNYHSHKSQGMFKYDVSGWFRGRIEGGDKKKVNPFLCSIRPSYKLPALKEGLSAAIKEIVNAA